LRHDKLVDNANISVAGLELKPAGEIFKELGKGRFCGGLLIKISDLERVGVFLKKPAKNP
jgi:hypothetical protein